MPLNKAPAEQPTMDSPASTLETEGSSSSTPSVDINFSTTTSNEQMALARMYKLVSLRHPFIDYNQSSQMVSTVELSIIQSQMPNAGIGTFVQGPVKAGKLIYKIKTPFLTVIKDGEDSMHTTCDNCYSTTAFRCWTPPSKIGQMELDKDSSMDERKLNRCAKCGVVAYCDRICQREAWLHHHKYECPLFKEGRSSTEFKDEDGKSLIWNHQMRLIIRLIALRTNYQLTADQLELFKTLDGNSKMDKPLRWYKLIDIINIVFPNCPMDVTDLAPIVTRLDHNTHPMHTPLLLGLRGYSPFDDLTCMSSSGYILEPNLAMLNHSCKPTARFVFEGNELRLFATHRNLKAGDEITICYGGDPHDYHKRRQYLKDNWNFDCTCVVCKYGVISPDPTDPEYAEFDLSTIHPPANFSKLGFEQVNEHSKKVHTMYADLVMKCFGCGTPQMAALLKYSVRCWTYCQYPIAALKYCLILYYAVQPVQFPKTTIEERLFTMYTLVNCLDLLIGDEKMRPRPRDTVAEQERQKALQGMPLTVQMSLHFLYWKCRQKLVRDMSRAFGKDSVVTVSEREVLKKEYKLAGYGMLKGKAKFQKYMFCVRMNRMLKWVKIPEQSQKKLYSSP